MTREVVRHSATNSIADWAPGIIDLSDTENKRSIGSGEEKGTQDALSFVIPNRAAERNLLSVGIVGSGEFGVAAEERLFTA